ncbi:MAG: exosortase/archaeosortase family protein [Candidatus Diapherotrites archaeon]|nr:exosortase/archaeosortase family protein [Candidatus Diapherotrites archaeon]
MNSKNFLQKIKSDLNNKSEQKKGLKFIGFFLIWFLVLNLLFLFIPLQWIEFVPAFFAWIVFTLIGFQGIIVLQNPVLIEFTNFDYVVSITYLCSGLLESIVLVSCILASIGISRKKRILGAIAGVIVLGIGNIARIVLSVLILKIAGEFYADLFHEILFKIFLFIGIAGIYLIWFLWATENKKFNELMKKVHFK